MKKLNRRGYMTIEIILASVVTFIIAFFLIDLTMSLVNVTDDSYADTVLTTDKGLIVKNIKNNIKNDICNHGNILSINCTNNNCNITMNDRTTVSFSVSNDKVEYRGGGNYFKDIDKSLSNITLNSSNYLDYYLFKISGNNIFSEENYDMNIIVRNEC